MSEIVSAMHWGDVATWFAAIATLLAVLVALYGDKLKSRWFRPGLVLRFRDRRGVFQRTELRLPDSSTRMAEARYYRLCVGNQGRWPIATNVQVFLLQIEEPGAAGAPRVTWAGELPFVWEHQAIYPLARTVGSE